MLAALKAWAGRLKREVLALWIAARSPDTPLPARLIALLVAAYALSPIDLIPDFIPVAGFTDDLGAIGAAMLIVAAYVRDDHRDRARAKMKDWFR